jgi:hypothetical protein
LTYCNKGIKIGISMKIEDSEAKPFIEQKDVILCRSGIQLYHKSELTSFITEDNKPPVEKEWYKEYRPANVIVKAQDLFKSLPVTKEHPDVWVDSKNWKDLAGGTLDKEVTVVALVGESEGEIGLKSNITFYTDDLYNYYLENKEVSVGYTCRKHFVDNPEEVGYDIVLDEITEVNHLAITRAGRGGSSVAVIDSIIGGLRPMRTGIFAYLKSKKQKAVNDSVPSFGKSVLEAVKNSKGTTEEELAVEMKGVLDSMSILKDCEAKDKLVDVVKDCFDNKDMAVADEGELVATLDAMWIDIHGDSLSEIAKAFAKLGKPAVQAPAPAEDSANKDSEPDDEGANKDSENQEGEEKDSKSEKDEGEEENKDSEADKKDKEEKDGCNKDSAPEVANMDAIKTALDGMLKPMVEAIVKDCLGIKENSHPQVEGAELDSVNKGNAEAYDYSSFLEQ